MRGEPVFATLRKKARFLARTPFHPQWLHRANSEQYKRLIASVGDNKTVLDIGCYNKWARNHLPPTCSYIGLDYYETASQWYGSVPDVYGNALSLPIAPASFDVVILIDVLEHISDTQTLLEQIHSVLKPGGKLLMSLPFLYPMHDAPRDFVRYTEHGIEQLARQYGFTIELCEPLGSPIVTSALLSNLALAKAAVNWIAQKRVWSVLALLFAPVILVNNLAAALLSKFEVKDGFMANSYQFVLQKTATGEGATMPALSKKAATGSS